VAVPDRRASIDATSTSPAVVVVGRAIVTVEPNVLAVVTAAPEGSALSAGPDPAMVTPRTSARARNGT
jgi:hypothetical protein